MPELASIRYWKNKNSFSLAFTSIENTSYIVISKSGAKVRKVLFSASLNDLNYGGECLVKIRKIVDFAWQR